MAGSGLRKKAPLSYQDREYRRIEASGLVSTVVKMAETDLYILSPATVEDQVLPLLSQVRSRIERYIGDHPRFLDALTPLPMDEEAPEVVRQMLTAGMAAGVGPMAAVAGAIAQWVGRALLDQGIEEVIVENGGDLFVARKQDCTVAVYAGQSPLSGKVGLRLAPARMACGVCCSSGTIGHSLSLGVADAVVAVARSTSLADAAATRLGNEVGKDGRGVDRALALAGDIQELDGVIIVSGDRFGAWGNIELVGL